jgi:ATP:corrinoid adenosyltransferase
MRETMEEQKETQAKEAASRDQVALELMKFVAVTTGYGKGGPAAGFGGAKERMARTPEEHADALLELFERCRAVVAKPSEPR